MQVSFSKPLDLAWLRMKGLLLAPFEPGRWFVLGFSAWLAGLTDGGVGNLEFQLNPFRDRFEGARVADWPVDALEGVRDALNEGLVFWVVGLILAAALLIGLLLLWIESRGRFVFLDNLVHRTQEIRRPWGRHAARGDSVFLWRVGFSLTILAVMALLVGGWVTAELLLDGVGASGGVIWPLRVLLGATTFILAVATLYVEFFLSSLVVPIMMRQDLGVLAAWRRFLALFRRHPGTFVLFGLYRLVIQLVGGLFYLIAGLLTCCLGLVLLGLPYLGAVLTLPLSVLCRYLDLEFLGQFGDEFRLLEPWTPPRDSGEPTGDGTVVRAEDLGQDPGGLEPGPQAP